MHGGVNKSPTVSEGGEAIEAPIVPGSEMLSGGSRFWGGGGGGGGGGGHGWWVWLGWVREGGTPPAPARGYGGAL